MNRLTLLLLILLIWLQCSLWLGKNGFYDYIIVNDNVTIQKTINARLKKRNNQLFVEIDDFSNNQEAIEEHARNELNMIKPGETFYRLVLSDNKQHQENIK